MTSARRACVRKLIPAGASSVFSLIGPVSKTRLGPDRPFNQHTRVFAQTRAEKEAANVLKPEVTSGRGCLVPTTAIGSNRPRFSLQDSVVGNTMDRGGG